MANVTLDRNVRRVETAIFGTRSTSNVSLDPFANRRAGGIEAFFGDQKASNRTFSASQPGLAPTNFPARKIRFLPFFFRGGKFAKPLSIPLGGSFFLPLVVHS